MMARFAVSLLLLLLCLPVCATEKLRVAGSTTVLPIVAEAAKAYRNKNPDVVLTISGGGSGVGIASISQGTVELAMASRSLTEREKLRLEGKVKVIPVARDAVAVAVSKAVYEGGVTHLTLDQIAAIYRGKVKNWKDVGGPDSKILVIDKEPSRGTRHVFAKVVLGDAKARAPGASIITGSNNEEQAAITNSDKAIGMLSNAWLNDRVRAIAVDMKGEAVMPDNKNIATGAYPIQRTLDILVPVDQPPHVASFVDFLLSKAGQQIVEQGGYLPIN